MTSLPCLCGSSRLQAGRGVLQTPTDNDDDNRAKQHWPIRQASNKMICLKTTI